MNQAICIILGDNYYNTYGVLRSLGETGIRPVFINVCSFDSWVSKSRYISSYHQVSSYDEGIQIMMTHYGSEKTKPVVFCTSDAGICAVDKVSDSLSESFKIPHASKEQGRINKLINKNVMGGIARDAGMFVPRSVTITPADYSESKLECVEYPCHLKPSSSLYGAKQDMRICRNRNELIEALDELKTRDKQVEVQEYIDKEYEIVIMGCALKSGKVVLPGTIVKTREWPYRGVTSATKTIKGLDGLDHRSIRFVWLLWYLFLRVCCTKREALFLRGKF